MDVERSDEAFQGWMLDNLGRAAGRFRLTVTGGPVFGWNLRSVSAPARGAGGPCWLRVGSERHEAFTEAGTDFWTGTVDANAVTGVIKPWVLDSAEWDVPEQHRRVRADVMTLVSGRPCSPTEILHSAPDVDEVWWRNLRANLDAVRRVPTTRFAGRGRDRVVLGEPVRVARWETVHGDLHWANLLTPCALVDWEMWGRGPAGMDAAGLYCSSLLVPETAAKVGEVFADVLDTPDGRIAQLVVAERLIGREGEFPELADLLRRHAERLLYAAAGVL